MLHKIIEGDNVTVTLLAAMMNLPVSTVSENLRILNARGLLSVKRDGRFVYYRLSSDQSMPDTARIMPALRLMLDQGIIADAQIFRDATSFTHLRRIKIIKQLKCQSLALQEIAKKIKASKLAAGRHLKKLHSRGLVEKRNGTYHFVEPNTPLLAALVDCCD